MKITIRTLKQEEYQFECAPTDTILSLKEQIKARLQHEIDWQTLIYSGAVLPNDRTIEACKIMEKGFMVLMVKKPRAAAAPAATPAVDQKPAPAQTTPATPSAAPVENKPAAATPSTPAATTPVTPAATTPATQAAPAGASEEVIARIIELGFPRDHVIRALEVSWNNPDRAVEILMMGGLPPAGAAVPMSPGLGEGSYDDGEDLGDDLGDDLEDGVNPFDLIKNTPQFQQLRLLAQQSPQMFEQVLQQLPPEIIQLINQNQEEFIRLLQEEPVQPGAVAGAAPAGAAGARRAPGGAAPPGTIQFRISPEEEAVINNLVDMTGVPKDQVIRAYALFERDVEMTANYLLNHGHDENAGFGGFQ